MTILHENLTRVLYPVICDLVLKANRAQDMTPAKAGQMASRPTAQMVDAVIEELGRTCRVNGL